MTHTLTLHFPLMRMGGQKETVEAERRRRPGTEPVGGRPRADTPRRETGGAPSGGTSGGSGYGSSGGGTFPGGGLSKGGKPLSLGAMLLVIACVVIYMMMQGGSGGEVTQDFGSIPTEEPFLPADTPEVVQAEPTTAKPVPTRTRAPAASTSGDQRWLVMLYQDADDKILEQDIYIDLNEAERVGSTDHVQIVAQIDRFRGGFTGDGNWSSAKRFYVTQDTDLNSLGSKQLADLGEVNMSSTKTLIDFVTWAVQEYPADKYVLILSDHGMGWPGGWSDGDSGGSRNSNIPLVDWLGNELYLNDLEQALGQIQRSTGIDKFELIGMDACLMGQLEVFSALEPYARYAVASQEVEPSLGWAYTGLLEELARNPNIDGAELSRVIVRTYIQDDQRIVDDQARAEFLRQGSPMSGFFSAFSVTPQQLAQQLEADVTLTAIDLAAIPDLMQSVNDLAYNLQGVRQTDIARARTYAQSFTSIWGSDVSPSYIDLGNFVQLLQKMGAKGDLGTAAQSVLSSMQQAIIAEKHGPKKPGATGVTIYFPDSKLYQFPVSGAESYTAIAKTFAEGSLWDDFLAYHYTGQDFQAETRAVVVPAPGSTVRGPGAGTVQVLGLTLSNQTAAPGRPVTISADISGQNIGHIYLFVGFYDEQSRSIYVADMDYLESSDTREVGGVYYPVWPENEFTLNFEWDPIVFAVNDGATSAEAVFNPQSYGATYEQAIYTVDGMYDFANGSDRSYARLIFSDGKLRQVLGFTEQSSTGAAREITPQQGDTFTVLEKWLDLNTDGSVSETTYQEGKMLTFGDQVFTWQDLSAALGRYIIGFMVEDLDGNMFPAYTQIDVE